MNNPNLKTTICGVTFNYPVITSSGTFGFGMEYNNFYNLSEIGGISVKGLTLKKRDGNRPPRIAETNMGILNSVGLQNPGVVHFVEKDLPILNKFGTRVIANIAGNTIDEYVEMARILSDSSVDMIEMNISCPNVKEGGVAFGVCPDMVEKITYSVKEKCTKPLIVKLSPNVSDIVAIAKAAENGGADCLSLINTLLGMKIDINTRKPILANNMGGLSGPAVMPVAVRMVHQVKNNCHLPIMGMGGIMNGNDAIEFFLAGANIVSIGTANFVDPYAPLKVRDGINDYLIKNNINDISDLVGKVILN